MERYLAGRQVAEGVAISDDTPTLLAVAVTDA